MVVMHTVAPSPPHGATEASSSAYLGYLEWTFPAGEKLVHALPVKDPSKHQIIHLVLHG
jgi:hypothetical protein